MQFSLVTTYVGSSTYTCRLMVTAPRNYVHANSPRLEPHRCEVSQGSPLPLRVLFRFAAQAWPPLEIGRVKRRVPEAASTVIGRETASDSDSFGDERAQFMAAEKNKRAGNKNR